MLNEAKQTFFEEVTNMKKLSVFVILLAALALTGCTPKDSGSSGSASDTPSTLSAPANDGPVDPEKPTGTDEPYSTVATDGNDGPASRVEPVSVGEAE